MSFTPKPYAIDVEYSVLDEPLKEAIRLWNAKTPPEQSANCKDCQKPEIQELMSATHQAILSGAGYDRWLANYVRKRIYDGRHAHTSALLELRDEANEFKLTDGGMIANWEVFNDQAFDPSAVAA